ncbi:MAG: hypothetical protein RDV41_10810, partial [Planctomycetota bacterium]|nr:hypothetical protein [Planctomycetota bacterium]
MGAQDEVLLGRHAVALGLITDRQLAQVLAQQQKLHGAKRIGDLLVEGGLLTTDQLTALLSSHSEALSQLHHYTQKPIGESLLGKLAVSNGLITEAQLNECLRIQGLMAKGGRTVRLGEVLVKKKYATPDQVAALMAQHGKRIMRCRRCNGQYNVAGGPEDAAPLCPKCNLALVLVVKLRCPNCLAQFNIAGSARPGSALCPKCNIPLVPPEKLKKLDANGTFIYEPAGLAEPAPQPAQPAAAPERLEIEGVPAPSTPSARPIQRMHYRPRSRPSAWNAAGNRTGTYLAIAAGVALVIAAAIFLKRSAQQDTKVSTDSAKTQSAEDLHRQSL